MVRKSTNGGIIGPRQVPTIIGGSGVWGLNDVVGFRGDGIWPSGDVAGDVVADTIYQVGQIMSSWPDTTPAAGGTLTVNGQALGSYDYRVVSGNQTVSAFSNTDWFTTTADSRSAFVVVRGNLTINSGQTFIPSNRKLFTVIFVTGDLAVAGSISMSARGANHSAGGGNVAAAAIRIATGTFSAVTNPQVPAAGGAVTAGPSSIAIAAGVNGTAGSAGGTGGGGTGGISVGNGAPSSQAGDGAAGTSFSGGSGGGGVRASGSNPGNGDGAANGAAGGNGNSNQAGIDAGGGAGNPGGTGVQGGNNGTDGTGGVLIIICIGQLSGSGSIAGDGADGGDTGTGSGATAGGGGSGGGSVTVMYGTDTSSITPTAIGGIGGVADGNGDAGNGGAGTARKLALA
jgi:hypothetical protein